MIFRALAILLFFPFISTTVWAAVDVADRIVMGVQRRGLLAREEYRRPGEFGWQLAARTVPSPLVLDDCFQNSFLRQCVKRREVIWLREDERVRLTRDSRVHFKGDRWWHRVVWTQTLKSNDECSAVSESLRRALFLSLENASRVQDHIAYAPAQVCYRTVVGWLPVNDWKPLSSAQLSLMRRLEEWPTPSQASTLLRDVASSVKVESKNNGAVADLLASRKSFELRREVASAAVGRCSTATDASREGRS